MFCPGTVTKIFLRARGLTFFRENEHKQNVLQDHQMKWEWEVEDCEPKSLRVLLAIATEPPPVSWP